MWQDMQTPLPIFEGEDEVELVRRFVELRAAYPESTYNNFELCQYIFRDLRDPSMRANQAALCWGNDLEIKERIRKAKLNGNKEPEELTKENWQARVLAVIEDTALTPQEKKAKLDGYRLYAEANNWIVKTVDKSTKDTTVRFPQVIYALDERAA
jgi:ATP-dependent DNA ligase